MGFLNKAEDWLVTHLMKPTDFDLKPVGSPPSDDVPIALTLFVLFSLALVATCGHFFAH